MNFTSENIIIIVIIAVILCWIFYGNAIQTEKFTSSTCNSTDPRTQALCGIMNALGHIADEEIDDAIVSISSIPSSMSMNESTKQTIISQLSGNVDTARTSLNNAITLMPLYAGMYKRLTRRSTTPNPNATADAITNFDIDWYNQNGVIYTEYVSGKGIVQVPRDNYSIIFEGYFKIPANNTVVYKFMSDDGVKFKAEYPLSLQPMYNNIGDTSAVNSWNSHGTYYTNLYPSKSYDYYMSFQISWKNLTGNASLTVQWNLNNTEYVNIPDSNIFY